MSAVSDREPIRKVDNSPFNYKQLVKHLLFAIVVIGAVGALIAGVLGMSNVAFFGAIGSIGSQALAYAGGAVFITSVVVKVLCHFLCKEKEVIPPVQLPEVPKIPVSSNKDEKAASSEESEDVDAAYSALFTLLPQAIGSAFPSPILDPHTNMILTEYPPVKIEEVFCSEDEEVEEASESSESEDEKVELPEQFDAAQRVLRNVRKELENIDFRNIDKTQLEHAKQFFQDNEDIRLVLLVGGPVKNQYDHPLTRFSDEYMKLECWIDSLERYLLFKQSRTITDQGEIEVADNGDCLFEASLWLSNLAGSTAVVDEEATQQEREVTVQWIKGNYQTDATLQRYLCNSLLEHYSIELEKTEKDIEEKQGILSLDGLTEEQITQTKTQLTNLISYKAELATKTLPPIYNALEGGLNKNLHSLIDKYLINMATKGVHGGAAELYALSCRHEISIKVYRKTGNSIDHTPYETINPQFTEKPVRHFTHTHNHYNAYFPEAS